MKFNLKNNIRLKINTKQLEYLKHISIHLSSKEEGGVVIGNKSLVNEVYTVINFYKADNISNRKNRYVCDARKVNEYIEKQWKKSSGVNNYIGEWHTHYEDYPIPSRVDEKMMTSILKRDNSPGQIFLFILGRKQLYIGGISSVNQSLQKLGGINLW